MAQPADVAPLESAVEADQEADAAHERCLRYLSFRPRSVREVEEYLRAKGYAPVAIKIVVNRLSQAGLVDDRQFASFWVSNRTRFSPRGRRAIRYELSRKGVDREIVEEAIESGAADMDLAVAAGRKKLETYRRLDPQEFRRRMLRYLSSRGFDYRDASAAFALLADSGEECT